MRARAWLFGPVAGTLLLACTAQAPPPGDGSALAACAAVEHPPLQDGGHLLGDAEPPVAYSSTPGTSGWHAAGAPRTGVFGAEDRLSEPEIVRVLEAGVVVAAYDPAGLDVAAVARLEELARAEFEEELTVTPFEGGMGAPLVLNAWGARQACARLDELELRVFVARFRGEGAGPSH